MPPLGVAAAGAPGPAAPPAPSLALQQGPDQGQGRLDEVSAAPGSGDGASMDGALMQDGDLGRGQPHRAAAAPGSGGGPSADRGGEPYPTHGPDGCTPSGSREAGDAPAAGGGYAAAGRRGGEAAEACLAPPQAPASVWRSGPRPAPAEDNDQQPLLASQGVGQDLEIECLSGPGRACPCGRRRSAAAAGHAWCGARAGDRVSFRPW